MLLSGCSGSRSSTPEQASPNGLTREQQKVWEQAAEKQRAAQEAAVAKQKATEDDPWGDKARARDRTNNPNKERDNERNVTAALGVASIRAAARNPDSVTFESVLITKDASTCYTYRAQNGFGGMNREHAVLLPKAKYLRTSAAVWNAHCAHKQGADVTFLVATLERHVR